MTTGIRATNLPSITDVVTFLAIDGTGTVGRLAADAAFDESDTHFLSLAAASTWAGANTPSVGTEISVYISGAPQSVIRFAYAGTGAHFADANFDGWIPSGPVSFEHFGAAGNGTTSDSAAILAAATYMNGLGGGSIYGYSRRYRVATSITIPHSVKVIGPHRITGAPGSIIASSVDYAWDDLTGALVIDSSATITLSGNAGLFGWFIYRYGVSHPVVNDSAFAGTAITVNGGDDVVVQGCLIAGFNRAIDHVDGNRGRYEDVLIDCVNGIRLNGNQDVPVLFGCHAWPFLSIGNGATGGDDLLRTGIAFDIVQADWCKLTNCFAYGYLRGFSVTANSVVLTSCGADNFESVPEPSSIGFYIAAARGKMVGCQAAAIENSAVRINNTGGQSFVITQMDTWGTPTNGIFIEAGKVKVSDSTLRTCVNGIHIANNAAEYLDGGGNSFEGCTNDITINATVTTSAVRLAPVITDRAAGGSIVTVASGAYAPPGITATATVNLPTEGSVFTISGDTGISALAGGWTGRVVTLIFGSNPVITHGTGSATSMRLSGAANFSTSAGATLTLLHNGTQWYEVGRSA